ncbi:MAG TPA: hypothetical protein VF572_05610 [Candidatus Saccharimonadales bacterium]|jgi:hypothetical protein
MQKQVHGLLQKEMTRKEFMATVGFGAATVMGFTSIFRLFGGTIPGNGTDTKKQTSSGYGSSAYGGSKVS